MITIPFRLDAEERLILSRTGASAGLHECLDFIPGSVLLGSLAAGFYGAWKHTRRTDLLHMFHSGAVSFGDAHPLGADGCATLPVPLSLHHAKPQPGKPVTAVDGDGRIVSENVFNLAATNWPDESGQMVQFRAGWLGGRGQLVRTAGGYLLKTARNTAKGGTPADGQLFGYSYLEAGQAFAGSIRIDPSLQALAEVIRDWIGEGRTIHVGRSHGAEFGRCKLAAFEKAGVPREDGEDNGRPLPDELRLLALSDWWLPAGWRGNAGELHPLLTSYAVRPGRTFLRFRRYSPWNGFRGFPDPERQVVVRGSVVTLVRDADAKATTLGELRAVLDAGGIGAGLAEGLGRVWVHPRLLEEANPVFPPSPAQDQPSRHSAGAAKLPADPYLAQIEQRWVARWIAVEADRLANQFVEDWKAFRPRPRRSQWAQLRMMARQATKAADFTAKFEEFTKDGAAKWKWQGKKGGMGNATLAETVPASWPLTQHRNSADEDPRSKTQGAKEQAFLAAVAEAARRLRDH